MRTARACSLVACLMTWLTLWSQQATFTVSIENGLATERHDEPVVIDLHTLNKPLAWHVSRAVVLLDGREVPCQLDDMDGDWRADELVFLADICPHGHQTYSVTLYADDEQTVYTPRVYAHMSIASKPGTELSAFETLGSSNVFNNLYHHGACFESELVGFRIYSDSRQNIDIYGKRTHRLELQTTCFNSTARHLADGYGHDVLWNGQSIACGTLRDWQDGIQLVSDVHRRGQRILSYGPLRTVMEMSDYGWHGTLCCRTRYTLYAGHRDVAVEARFDTPLPDGLRFCTGVQKVGAAPEGLLTADGLAASWGRDWPDYGKKQLYCEQTVGLAVCMPQQYIYDMVEDSLNYLFVIHAPGQTAFHYWLTFCADMEQQSPYHTAGSWFAALPSWRERLLCPLKIRVGKVKVSIVKKTTSQS